MSAVLSAASPGGICGVVFSADALSLLFLKQTFLAHFCVSFMPALGSACAGGWEEPFPACSFAWLSQVGTKVLVEGLRPMYTFPDTAERPQQGHAQSRAELMFCPCSGDRTGVLSGVEWWVPDSSSPALCGSATAACSKGGQSQGFSSPSPCDGSFLAR